MIEVLLKILKNTSLFPPILNVENINQKHILVFFVGGFGYGSGTVGP